MNVQSDTEALAGLHWSELLPSRQPRRFASREQRRIELYLILMAIDAAAIATGFAIGNLIRYGALLGAPREPSMVLLLLPIYLIVALIGQAYTLKVLQKPRFGVSRALLALVTASFAVVTIAFFLKAGAEFSRFVFVSGSLCSALMLAIGRHAFAGIVQPRSPGALLAKIVILDGGDAPKIDDALVVDAVSAGLHPDVNDPHSLDRLGRFVHGADRVIVACTPERRRDWALALKGAHIQGEIVDQEVADVGAIGTRSYGDTSTLVVSNSALGLRSRVAKRLLDTTLAVGAILVLMPLLVLVAIAVHLEDRGPVFFTQPRLGRGNRLFRMYKFRSMRTEDCDVAGNRSTGRDDDRITRVGGFIRKTSIDELPQLLNILRGDMSFVGPRPHALGSLAGDQLFWEVDQRYWHRHNIKPGLTGLAQIRGFRGATLQRADLTNRLQADLEYSNGWTLWRDIYILLATVRVVVHRNAF